MTVTDMLDTISEELRKIFRGYSLQNKLGVMQEVRIFQQYIPQPAGITVTDRLSGVANYTESDYERNFPGIVVKLGDITDSDDRRLEVNNTGLRLLFGVYDDSPDGEGWRDVAGMMEKVRFEWLKDRIIAGKFRIILPITTRLLDDTYPVYFGEMTCGVETGIPRRPRDFVYGIPPNAPPYEYRP